MTEATEATEVFPGPGGRRKQGVFTAGALDYLMEKEVKFPYVVGVSAGSCNALDYVSLQPGAHQGLHDHRGQGKQLYCH